MTQIPTTGFHLTYYTGGRGENQVEGETGIKGLIPATFWFFGKVGCSFYRFLAARRSGRTRQYGTRIVDQQLLNLARR